MAKSTWINLVATELILQKMPITRLQGNVDAPVLLIAPVPTARTIAQNLTWGDEIAEAFFTLMLESVPLTMDQFLIMPTTFDGKKPNVRNTKIGSGIIANAAKDPRFKAFICIGSSAFVAYFGHGKKPDMNMLCGTCLKVPETKFKPLLVLHDVEPLVYSYGSLSAKFGRDRRAIQDALKQQKNLLEFFQKKHIFEQIGELCEMK